MLEGRPRPAYTPLPTACAQPPTPASLPRVANHWHQPRLHAHPPPRPPPSTGLIWGSIQRSGGSSVLLPPPESSAGADPIQLICIMMKPSSVGWILRGLGRNMPCPLERHTEGSVQLGKNGAPGGWTGVARNRHLARQGQLSSVAR